MNNILKKKKKKRVWIWVLSLHMTHLKIIMTSEWSLHCVFMLEFIFLSFMCALISQKIKSIYDWIILYTKKLISTIYVNIYIFFIYAYLYQKSIGVLD